MQIIVDGTIAPYLWNGNNFFQDALIDPGYFAPAGTSLTGMPIHIVWNSDPAVTAAITIDGVTVMLGPAQGFFVPYALVTPTYQNITVALVPNVAINSYDPAYALKYNPFGIGGELELVGLDGYFYVTSMVDPVDPISVPGPVAGEGSLAMALLIGLIVYRVLRRKAAATLPPFLNPLGFSIAGSRPN